MSESVGSKVRRSFQLGWAIGGSDTLTDVLLERGLSLPKAMMVCRYVALWGLYREGVGVEPASVDEIVERLKVPRRTAFRWQAAFRDAFPELQSPAVLWEMVREDVRGEDPSSVAVQIGAARL